MNMNYSHFPILRPKGTALAFALLFSSTAPVLAENVTYPGASLQNASFLFNIVTPSLNSSKDKSNSLENNTVTVNSGGVVPRNVSGAINLRDEDAVRNNYVIVNEGAVVGDGIGFTGIYGGYSL
ncbi:MAG: hypothetical protein FWH56_11745, partial [Betaproteobacteria bacterium]|nr:hypothetical protein [Betaproteobacteria bacterium]